MEALLAEDAGAENFLERPALEAVANMLGEDQAGSLTGRQIGSYHILSLLGMGGMGEVYRARDLKLKREVAIKVLPEEFSHDAARVARFQREAEVLASLSHPHIAAIYDLTEFEDLRCLILELVEGEWAFGCILYELLTSRSPFQGQTLADTVAAVLEREPDWQALPPSTPPKIRDLLRRLLQKDPFRRQRDLGDAGLEVEAALAAARLGPPRRKFAVAGVAALALLAVLAAVIFVNRFTTQREVIDSVAILPFVNAGADPDAEYLSDGITESLINNLAPDWKWVRCYSPSA